MLSLYIHIPFCVRKCHYCGFYSTVYSELAGDAYIEALRIEASGYQRVLGQRVFDTVYIGGGTPTVLSIKQMTALVSVIKDFFRIARGAEWTVEANPNSVSASQLALFRDRGVNRLSLGVQSFHDDILRILGRLHTAEEAVTAFHDARNAGFGTIGMDLIYGVPGQTAKAWSETLEKAIDLHPDHISAYSLSIDEGSWFSKEEKAGRFAPSGDDEVAFMYERAVEMLSRAGYCRYELSNFSLPGHVCRHNMNYWTRGEYLGLGPGAWSFIDTKRYHAVSDVREYAARLKGGVSVIADSEEADATQAANETIMLGLRTAGGVDLSRFGEEFGPASLKQLECNTTPLLQAGLIVKRNGRIMLTERGFLLANDALARLAL